MILREGLLDGTNAVIAGASAEGPHAAAIERELRRLGARTERLQLDPLAGDPAERGRPSLPQGEEDVKDTAPAPVLPADLVVWDGAGAFGVAAGVDAARAALDGAWMAIRAAVDVQVGSQKVVLVAPPPGDAHAQAARAGLENLARVLSIEWARFEVRPNAILPGEPQDVAQVAAYLASPAGDYFSGTALTLR